MSGLVLKGRVVELDLRIVVPETVTQAELADWINMNLLEQGSIHKDNPLYTHPVDATLTEARDTGCFREVEVSNISRTETGIQYSVTRRDVPDRRNDVEVGRWEDEETIKQRALDAFRAEEASA